ncbi:non-ribosomal peptide synthetase [Rheinheimera riviphila]|uniref:Non-ribosomal peptide synthetase n=1 Tax=Rheinheimera riviphila TaxID=1834037 RepID=A0A437QIZ7_9GAMM|nr:AMP-binding protein [Rheinheimera riviphila]RVU34495.1 non-ribosomal peptide synthetase [Rheinheimera riviphila]
MKQPLTLAQQGIWLGQQMNGQSALYNTAECIAFAGKINADLLCQALRQAVGEAEVVSCLYLADTADDSLSAWREHTDLPLQIDELVLDGPRDRDFFTEYARAQVLQPIELGRNLPIRFVLFRAPAQDYLFNMSHHIALDGYGNAILFRRVAVIYNALLNGNSIPACPFGSMAAVFEEEQQWQQQKQLSAQYWQQQCASWPQPVSFVTGTGALQPYYLRQSQHLSRTQWQQLQQLAEQHRISWPDLLLASLSALLQYYSGENRLCLGLIMMNRIGSKALQVPCMHTNIVPLFADIEGETLLSLAQQLARRKRELRPYQSYRYEEMKRDQHKVSERLYGPLVNIMPFDYAATFGDVASRTLHLVTGTVEDLILEVYLQGDAPPLLDFDANPNCYSNDTLAELRCLFFQLLDAQLAAPDTTLINTNQQLLAKARAAALLGTEASAAPDILQSIARQVQQRGEHCAISAKSSAESAELSYQALWQQVAHYHHALQQQALPAQSRIGLLLSRQPATIALLLACLAGGYSFVALDVTVPPARLQQQLALATPQLLICEDQTWQLAQQLAAQLPEQPAVQRLSALTTDLADGPSTLPYDKVSDKVSNKISNKASANDEAYLLFTSGSSGVPKAVPIHRGALSHFVMAAAQRYGWQAQDRVLQFAPLHFDASIEEIFVSLSVGATLVLRDDAALQSMADFQALLTGQRISVADLPTAFFHEWVLSLQDTETQQNTGALPPTLPPTLRQVIVGGEALKAELLTKWQQQVARSQPVTLINSYGPTETTVVALCQDVSHWQPDALLPIGTPLPGVQALVLDRHDRPAASGELVLLGPTVSAGYVGLSAAASQTTAHQQLLIGDQIQRLYRTGDAVQLQDGLIYYCGRQDDEFKLSGYRIQPGEIEQALCRHPAVQQAVVLGISNDQQRYLQAWLVCNTDLTPAQQAELPAELRRYLAETLPAALIPSRFTLLPALPLNRNNKVDKALLRTLPAEQSRNDNNGSSDLSGTAAKVAEIWRQVLGIQALQPQDNFFTVGGQSLQTIQVMNRLSRELGLHLKVSDAFNHPTLQQLADHIDNLQHQDSAEELVW